MAKSLLFQKVAEYSVSHQNPLNKKIHNICVPLIEFSVFGLLSLIPGTLNWMWIVFVLSMFYYGRMGATLRVWLQVLVLSGAMVFLVPEVVELTSRPVLLFSSVFVVAWIGQFYGHYVEGRKPSFIQDLQFLLIGPVWVFAKSSVAAAADPSDRV